MSTSINPLIRIAWLVGDRAVTEFEMPLLRSLGFEVYQTRHAPLDRGPECDSIADSSDAPSSISVEERAALDAHDFYEHEMTPAIARILNRRFDAVICSCYEHALREILTHYRGRVVIRATPAERFGLSSYGDSLRRGSEASLWSLFREAAHRVWFAPIDDILPENEDRFLRSRFIRLPAGIPESVARQSHLWTRQHRRVLVFQLDASSQDGAAKNQEAIAALLGDIPGSFAGLRPKDDNDGCAAAFVPANVLERWPWSFGENAAAAADSQNSPHHPFEAILRGMPTIFMRDAYVDRLGAADLPGACTSLREARVKLKRILDGDLRFIEILRGSQPLILSMLNPWTTRAVWTREFADGVMAEPIEPPPEARALERADRPRRLAVILPKVVAGSQLRTAINLIKILQLGSQKREPSIDVVVAAPVELEAALADLKVLGVQIRPLRWKSIAREAKCIADLIASGIAMKLDNSIYAQPVDGGNDLLDCDSWLVVGDEVPHPLLPIRPYGAVLFDYAQRYVTDLFDQRRLQRQAVTSIPFARNAKYLIVTTPSALADVNAFAGVPRRKIRQTPLFFDLPRPCDAPPIWADGYFVWHVDDDFNNLDRIVAGLVRYFAQCGGRLRGIIVAPASQPRGEDDASGVFPQGFSETIRAAVGKQPALAGRLEIVGDVSNAEYVRILQHARFLVHGNIHGGGSLSVVDAASLGVHSLAGRYPAMEFLNQTCGLNLTFFDPRDPGDLARALKAMETRQQSPRIPEKSFLEAFHWRNAVSAVCDAVFPHVENVPTIAYR